MWMLLSSGRVSSMRTSLRREPAGKENARKGKREKRKTASILYSDVYNKCVIFRTSPPSIGRRLHVNLDILHPTPVPPTLEPRTRQHLLHRLRFPAKRPINELALLLLLLGFFRFQGRDPFLVHGFAGHSAAWWVRKWAVGWRES